MQELLGYKSVKTTMIYTQVLNRDGAARAVRSIAEMLNRFVLQRCARRGQ